MERVRQLRQQAVDAVLLRAGQSRHARQGRRQGLGKQARPPLLSLRLSQRSLPDTQQQRAYADKVLKENANVRWTIVSLHHPVWNNAAKNGWGEVEKLLKGRNYT